MADPTMAQSIRVDPRTGRLLSLRENCADSFDLDSVRGLFQCLGRGSVMARTDPNDLGTEGVRPEAGQLRKTFSSLPSIQRSTSSTPCIREWSWFPISYFQDPKRPREKMPRGSR